MSKTRVVVLGAKWLMIKSVKEMQGIIRFDQHLTAIANHADKPLSQIHNFYDQAHFINDFKQRTGMTPKNYKALCLAFPSARHFKTTSNI